MEANHVKTSEIEDLEDELHILKSIADMDYEVSQRAEMYITEVTERVDSRRSFLEELQCQWYSLQWHFCLGFLGSIFEDTFKKLVIFVPFCVRNIFAGSFEERTKLVELELYSDDPDHREKFSQLKQIEKETDAVLSELQQRYKE